MGMINKEKEKERVIKGLECCKIPFTKCYNGGCPYFENDGCKARLKSDALALLKAQEQEIQNLKQEIEGHKDNLRETLDEMMRYADMLKVQTRTIEQFEREREQQMWDMPPIGGFHDD